jgi:hypothetical protein
MDRSNPGVAWLLASDEPSIRLLALTEVLGLPPDHAEVREARPCVLDGPVVRALLSGQQSDGGFGVHPYQKWTGAFWRLISLVEAGLPERESTALAAVEQVLGWLTGSRLHRVPEIDGRVRRCASQEGYAVAVCARLGMAGDPRVEGLAARLVEWQWPDGGWNCDKRPAITHSSFHETLGPLWGLAEYHRATGDPRCRSSADRAAEFFLQHRLYRSHVTGQARSPHLLKLRWPPYWHYDVLRGLVILARAGRLADARARDALDVVASKMRSDGTWSVEGAWWKRVGGTRTYSEVVDWGRRGPNPWLTLSALSVLRTK